MAQKPSLFKRGIHRLMALDLKDRPIQTEEIPVLCPGVPVAFEGARVAVVADLHLPDRLVSAARLLDCLKQVQPDAIFLPGDLTNSYTYFADEGLRCLAEALVKIAPCFATPGNHEWRLEREPLYRAILTKAGVHYLCDNSAVWEKGGATLRLWGAGLADEDAPHIPTATEHPAILLAHHPEYLTAYAQAGWDLVVCGHAHGGHVRVGNRALFSPDQGFFPKYTGGVHRVGATQMVVSRGLGNSSLPWRLNNPPHLPILVLSAQEK